MTEGGRVHQESAAPPPVDPLQPQEATRKLTHVLAAGSVRNLEETGALGFIVSTKAQREGKKNTKQNLEIGGTGLTQQKT